MGRWRPKNMQALELRASRARVNLLDDRSRQSEKPKMSYLAKNLIPGEKLIFRTGVHWSVLIGPALAAIIAPSTNSYKRLVPGFEAPVNLAYSRRNRSAACRIPMYSTSPAAKRVEFRPPDPSCNPYLAFAAMLMAGLDGIENKMDPGPPLDKDIYELDPEELASVPSMPGSLEEALDALERDHAFLLKGDVFTEEMLRTYVDYKRSKEVDAIRLRPHPYEFALYYDI